MEDAVAIAVVGLSLGFPQDVTTSDALWELMWNKRNTATKVPSERLNIDSIYHPDRHRRGQVPVRHGHFMNRDLAAFDAAFFDTSMPDAASMDPQQRLLLEYAYTALENAGLPMEKAAGTKTSVYTGSFSTDWMQMQYKDSEESTTTTALGVQASCNANKISWFFNFKGNSANIDTACSSSLVCLDLGCRDLQCGRQDMSIVAGSNIMLSPDNLHSLSNLNMLSPDGQCYSFDYRANGYSRGEGVAVLVLKRVTDAIRDNDTIRGIIRSTGCNQDGRTSSLTLPSSEMQARLIRDTYINGGLSMEPTRYFEAHGTGTPVGDPTEAKAIGSAFGQVRTLDDPLWVGSVKSNIGHLEGASGIAGVIRAMLILEKGIISPTANIEKVNPNIDCSSLKIQFPLRPTPWPTKGLRRASVNSFGNSGTNAHVILDDVFHFLKENQLSAQHLTVQDPPTSPVLQQTSINISRSLLHKSPNSSPKENRPRLLVFSANDEAGVRRQATAYAEYFTKFADALDSTYLDHLAYTLSSRRSSLPWKGTAIVSSMEDMTQIDRTIVPAVRSKSDPGLVFVFAGQGAQWAGMGRDLMTLFPEFNQSLERSEQALLGLGCSWHLREEIMRQQDSRINSPELAQPCCTAIQLALVDLLHSWNVHASAAVGHSSGEVAAAYCVGALSAGAALKLAYYRGAVCSVLASGELGLEGAMMSVGLCEEDVQQYLDELALQDGNVELVVACINSPCNVTVSGNTHQIAALKARLDQKEIFAQQLPVNVAYHSPHMLRVADQYREVIKGLESGTPLSSKPGTVMFSSVTGKQLFPSELLDPEYWVQNLVSRVRFRDAVAALMDAASKQSHRRLNQSCYSYSSFDIFLEISPHRSLHRPLTDTVRELSAVPIKYTSLMVRGNDATLPTMRVLGDLVCHGYSVCLDRVNHLEQNLNQQHYIALPDLPSYVFDHSHKYWNESRLSARSRLGAVGKLDLLGKPVVDWNPLEPRWKNCLRGSEMPWIEDHLVNGVMIYPGAGMLVMAIEAANQITKKAAGVMGFEISEVHFKKPLHISKEPEGVETQLSMHLAQDSVMPLNQPSEFRLFCYSNNDWQECCHGFIRAKYQVYENPVTQDDDNVTELATRRDVVSSIEGSCQTPIDRINFYSGLTNIGMVEGPAFWRVKEGFYDDQYRVRATIGLFRWPEDGFPQPHVIHPTSLDSIFHLALIGYCHSGKRTIPTMIPSSLRRLYVSKTGLSYPDGDEVQEYTWPEILDRRGACFSGFALNQSNGALSVQFSELRLTTIASSRDDSVADALGGLQLAYQIQYQPEPDFLDPKDVLLNYKHASRWDSLTVERYIDMLAHKNGDLRILELNVGDRSSTKALLHTLSVYNEAGEIVYPRYSSFTMTATSVDILDQRKIDLHGFSFVKFALCDISQDIASQKQYLEGPYDIILAPDSVQGCLMALHNLKSLVSPTGKVFLFGGSSNPHLAGHDVPNCDIVQGLAPNSDLLYSGLELQNPKFKNVPDPLVRVYHGGFLDSQTREIDKPVFLIMDAESTVQTQVAGSLATHWARQHSFTVQMGSLEEALAMWSIENLIFVVLLELDQPFLYEISYDTYNTLNAFFQKATHVLWATFAGGTEAGRPEYHLIHGLARALRHEYPLLNITVAALEETGTKHLSQWHLQILTRLLFDKHANPNPAVIDSEFLELRGYLHIPRIVPSASVTHELHRRWQPRHSGFKLVKDCLPLELTLSSVGILDSLCFSEDANAHAPLAADEVEIQTHAIGMNFRDLLIAMGQIPDAPMGQECTGVVLRAGTSASCRPGDRVILAHPSTFKTVARGKMAIVIPDNMPFTTAAAIPAQFGTAWEAVNYLARLEKNETILIHAAAGGTGQAVIQIAQCIGATILATVGSTAKKNLLMDRYGIPENQIFYSRDTTFVAGVKRATAGRGVDVILNSLAGDGLLASLDCIAPGGRFIEIGRKDIDSNSHLPMSVLSKNISFIVFDGSVFLRRHPSRCRSNLQLLVDMFTRRELHPVQPFHVYNIGEVETVFRKVQMGESMGKFVLEVTPESRVPVTLNTRPSFDMDSDSTFVLAGGLGGIGRAAARWMAERGAKNLVLLSRYGPRTNAATVLVNELRTRGVRVETPACDVTNLEVMKEVFGRLSSEMPPIKGVIQMSIVARDCLFSEMPYPDWKDAVNCKSLGSWNLHRVLPRGMDFFILLSSASGLAGIKGQANYDAGNTYEDGLARYRVSQGEKATALDLGAMVDDGILAEDPSLLRRVLAYGTLEPITRAKFYGILDYYCDPARDVASPHEAQIALGLGTGGGEGLESIDYQRQPMLQQLMLAGNRQQVGASASVSAGGTQHALSDRERIVASSCPEEAAQIAAEAIIKKLAKSLITMQDSSSVDRDRPISELGVDSLLGIELRNWVVKEFKIDLAVFETQGAATLETLSLLVAQRCTKGGET
ncbi:putative polyketide synthase [Aspergillus pseudotamarii]|uniref:Putative polyketide synthase n=1 Tax=Aspergillus pseudotamarii TaxID=132259 RepID=A0A5N6SUW1_ASPPS|nr:putative polyketide synthase [Aspergillus pseudotamarii]KAE8137530.1 putative polyketide synthase [Aspergillus pseudotamarii]